MVKYLSKIFLFLLTTLSLLGQTKGIGVIFPNLEISEQLEKILEEELKLNFEGSELVGKIEARAYLDKSSMKDSIAAMNKNRKVDGVFVLDYNNLNFTPQSSKYISYPLGFLPLGKETAENIEFIFGEPDIVRDIEKIKEIKDIKRMAFYISSTTENYKKTVSEKLKKIGVESKFYQINSSQEELENQLLQADGVYIISNDDLGVNILERAKEKKIPSFVVSLNPKLVEDSLMGYDLSTEMNKRVRTAVFNYVNYLTGERQNSVKNLGLLKSELFFNSSISNIIELYPGILFVQGMKLVEDKNTVPKLKLNFKDAIDLGIKNNISLKAQLKNIESKEYGYWSSNSKRLPKASAGANYSYLDKAVVSPLSGAENSMVGLLKLSQVIYDDSLNAEVYSQKLSFENSKLQYNQGVLDTIYNIATSYLTILQLRSQLEIQTNNYNLVREFLRVSKIKYETGATGIQDVYRLEGVLSDVTSSLAGLKAQLKNQEKVLNTFLNIPIVSEFSYQNIEELSNEFFLGKEFLDKFLFDREKDRKFFFYLSEVAISNSNQLKAIENNIKILERQEKSLSRSRFIPTISAFGQYSKNNVVSPWGKGDEFSSPNNWRAGIMAEIPIFTSGEIQFSKKSVESDIGNLEYQKEDFKNQLTQNVNLLSTNLLSDYVQTFTSKKAAEAANKSLDLYKNLYALGSISTTEILDARNAAITSELSYTISNYNFFISAMNLERVLGKYKIFTQGEEREEELRKLERIVVE